MAEVNVSFYPVSTFYKVGPDYKVLQNEEYVITSMKGEVVANYHKEDNGRFRIHPDYDEESLYVGNAEKLIPEFIYNDIVNSSTVDEVTNAFNDNYYYFYNNTSNHNIRLEFKIPVLIKQIKSEPGYQKSDIMTVGHVRATFYYGDNNSIGHVDLHIEIRNFYDGFIYGEEIPEYNSLEDLKTMNQLDRLYLSEGACLYTNAGMIITEECNQSENFIFFSTIYRYVPYFIAKKGEVKFTINNTVNGLAKYNASEDKNLEYKITVKNTGNALSSENKIVTYVPSGVTVNTESISDSGEYSKNNSTITWSVSNIDVDETVEFSYKATAPASLNGKELVGHSTVESGQVLNAVYSNNTVVTMDKIVEVIKNPETGTMVYVANTNIGLPLSYLIMFVVILAVTILVLIKKLKKST